MPRPAAQRPHAGRRPINNDDLPSPYCKRRFPSRAQLAPRRTTCLPAARPPPTRCPPPTPALLLPALPRKQRPWHDVCAGPQAQQRIDNRPSRRKTTPSHVHPAVGHPRRPHPSNDTHTALRSRGNLRGYARHPVHDRHPRNEGTFRFTRLFMFFCFRGFVLETSVICRERPDARRPCGELPYAPRTPWCARQNVQKLCSQWPAQKLRSKLPENTISTKRYTGKVSSRTRLSRDNTLTMTHSHACCDKVL
jgi:hypothetical protein